MIGILMAVYNGEAYLREQLSGIFTGIKFLQRHASRAQLRLLVSDDGSTDGSLAILEEYKRKYPQSMEILHRFSKDAPGDNPGNMETEKGAAGNFFFLLREAQKREEISYWLFADQDDVWFPEKIVRRPFWSFRILWTDIMRRRRLRAWKERSGKPTCSETFLRPPSPSAPGGLIFWNVSRFSVVCWRLFYTTKNLVSVIR